MWSFSPYLPPFSENPLYGKMSNSLAELGAAEAGQRGEASFCWIPGKASAERLGWLARAGSNCHTPAAPAA